MTNRFPGLTVAAGIAATLSLSAPAHAVREPINEGSDLRPCATYEEHNHVYLGMSEGKVRRVLDTNGQKVSKRAIDNLITGLIDLGPHQTVGAPVKYREVRSYPTCAEDGVPATFLVEFNTHTDRVTQALWM